MAEAPTTPRVVVLACGNVSRGDDAIGPVLLSKINSLGLANLTAVEDYQLQIEHALDIDGRDLVLFVDAGEGTPAPFTFDEIGPSPAAAHKSSPPRGLTCWRGCRSSRT